MSKERSKTIDFIYYNFIYIYFIEKNMEINKIEEPALETNTECSKIPKTIDFIYYNTYIIIY